MTEKDLEFLSLIGSTDETSFSELCQQLGDDCPDNKDEWRELFQKCARDFDVALAFKVADLKGR